MLCIKCAWTHNSRDIWSQIIKLRLEKDLFLRLLSKNYFRVKNFVELTLSLISTYYNSLKDELQQVQGSVFNYLRYTQFYFSSSDISARWENVLKKDRTNDAKKLLNREQIDNKRF